MADESDKQDTPPIPPKLNLRKQGILKQEPTIIATRQVKQETSRLVVQPAQATPPASPAEPAPAPAPAASTPAAAPTPSVLTPKPAETPAIKLQPLKPKPISTPAAATAAPSAAPSAAPTPATDPTKADTKRKTARIPLEQARPAEVEARPSLAPKTIKIKPVAPIPKIRATQPLSITVPMSAEGETPVHVDAEKRKTSRIPLEEALTADKESAEPAEPADAARPKTIKIKRPGGAEAATVRLKKSPAEAGSTAGEMGKTARLDTLPLEEPDVTPTQKKTIRVKRPDAPKAGGSGLETGATGISGLGLRPPEPDPESDEPGAVWAIFGIAATLVLCVVIYVLAAQAFGPNVSGTQLSSWKDGPNLSWPGKILN